VTASNRPTGLGDRFRRLVGLFSAIIGMGAVRVYGEWEPDQTLILSTHALVRTRKVAATWVNWSHTLGGGPQVNVWSRGLEVIAPQGMMLEPRHVLVASRGATMHIDEIGWAGMPVRKRRCISVLARDRRGFPYRIAITPQGDIDATWRALIAAGMSIAPNSTSIARHVKAPAGRS
jgi:hypothetical protein